MISMARKCRGGKLFKKGDIVTQLNPEGKPGRLRERVVWSGFSQRGRCVMQVKPIFGQREGKVHGVRFTEHWVKVKKRR